MCVCVCVCQVVCVFSRFTVCLPCGCSFDLCREPCCQFRRCPSQTYGLRHSEHCLRTCAQTCLAIVSIWLCLCFSLRCRNLWSLSLSLSPSSPPPPPPPHPHTRAPSYSHREKERSWTRAGKRLTPHAANAARAARARHAGASPSCQSPWRLSSLVCRCDPGARGVGPSLPLHPLQVGKGEEEGTGVGGGVAWVGFDGSVQRSTNPGEEGKEGESQFVGREGG